MKRVTNQRKEEKGQVALLGILIIMVFVMLLIGMTDVYRLLEMRSWAYQTSQRAAADGVTTGIQVSNSVRPTSLNDLVPCVGKVQLNTSTAESQAKATMNSYLADRSSGFGGPTTVVVAARNDSGSPVVFYDNPVRGYPDNPARDRFLSSVGTSWTATEPSVVVAGVITVKTFLGSFVGAPTIDITYFSVTSVHQPDNLCPN